MTLESDALTTEPLGQVARRFLMERLCGEQYVGNLVEDIDGLHGVVLELGALKLSESSSTTLITPWP